MLQYLTKSIIPIIVIVIITYGMFKEERFMNGSLKGQGMA